MSDSNHPFEEDHWRDRQYLGDGVYAAHDGYQVWVCATDGVRSTPKVALERETLVSLLSYAQKVGVLT